MDQITSADAGEIVCNAVFRLSISCSVPEIFAIKVRIRPKSRQKHAFGPIFFGGGPQILDLVFKIAPFPIMWQSFAAIAGETAEISRWIKKRKKETAAKHKGSCVALSQRAALTSEYSVRQKKYSLKFFCHFLSNRLKFLNEIWYTYYTFIST